MWDWYKAELLRFRVWACAAFLIHLSVLGFMVRMVDPLQQPEMVYQIVASIYGLVGLLFGVAQMASWRRPNTWLNLLHRPVGRLPIAGALLGAGLTWLLIAIALPLALMIAAQSELTARVVDSRHWMLPIAAALIGIGCYLAAAYAALAPKRWSVLILVLPATVFASHAVGASALLIQALVAACALGLVILAFKPDLSAGPRQPLAVLVTSVPVIAAVYLLLVMASLLYQLAWIVSGSHPLNGRPPPGGYVEASRSDAGELMLAGLRSSAHADVALWRAQVELSEIYRLQRQFSGFPQRHELTNIQPMEFNDEEARIRWTFSHDTMRYMGMNLADRSDAGVLGVGSGNEAFESPPLTIGNDWIITANTLYQYDAERRLIKPRINAGRGELWATGPVAAGEAAVLLSDQAMYFHDARALAEQEGVLKERQRVPLSDPIGSLDRIDWIELLDGHLISLTYGLGSVDDAASAWQTLLRVDGADAVEVVAERSLSADFPAALRHYPWWLSPACYGSRRAVATWLAPEARLLQQQREPRPDLVRGLAWTLMVLSLAAVYWLGRRKALPKPLRWLWLALGAVFGLPALIAMILIQAEARRS